MPAQPADLSKELFARLVHAAGQEMPDELEIRRLERDAKALLKVHPSKAYQIMGGIAALRWDFEAIRSNHAASLRHSTHAQTYANYATSMQLVGFYDEAFGLMETASDKQPENLGYLRTAVSYAVWAGKLRKALELERRLHKREPDHVSDDKVDLIEETLDLTQRHGIDEAHIGAALSIAFDVLRSKKIRYSHIGLMVDSDQDTVFFSIQLNRPVKEIVALDAELGSRIADSLPDLSSALVVQFEPEPSQEPKSRVNVGQTARSS